jgi:ribonucleoside-diphosphate reductase alpha chain
MISCKSGSWWEKNPQRGRTQLSELPSSQNHKEYFMDLWERIQKEVVQGEPGIYLSNDKDWGTNPCCEIGLRPFQFCNLTEVNVSNLESQEDFESRVRGCLSLVHFKRVTVISITYVLFGKEPQKKTLSLEFQ